MIHEDTEGVHQLVRPQEALLPIRLGAGQLLVAVGGVLDVLPQEAEVASTLLEVLDGLARPFGLVLQVLERPPFVLHTEWRRAQLLCRRSFF